MALTKATYSMIRGAPVNVLDYGADPTGTVDSTAAIQDAATAAAGNTVILPEGTYLVSAPITFPQRTSVLGVGRESTFVKIASNMGDVFVFGSSSDANNYALGSEVGGIFFYVDRPMVTGATSTLQYKDTNNGSFIRMYGARRCSVHDCQFWWKSRHVVFHGGSLNYIYDNDTLGVWDTANSSLQECEYSLGVLYSAVHGAPKDYYITGNSLYGLQSASRSVTYDSYGSVTQTQSIGPKYHIYSDCLETLTFIGNYVGQAGDTGISINAANLVANLRISDNFFDQNNFYDIFFNKSGSNYSLNTTISGNIFNGQQKAFHGIGVINPSDGTVVASSLNISDNIFGGYGKSPITLGGAWGALITGNVVRDYNCQYATLSSGADIDGNYAAAVFLHGANSYTQVTGNLFGGGSNNYNQVANGCSYGVYSYPSNLPVTSETNNVNVGLNTAMSVGMLSSDQTKTGFLARGVTVTTGTGSKLFGSLDFDYRNDFNETTGVYTAPVTGLYFISVSGTSTNAGNLIIHVNVDGSDITTSVSPNATSASVTSSIHYRLNKGSTVTLRQSGGEFYSTNAVYSAFSVQLVTQTGAP